MSIIDEWTARKIGLESGRALDRDVLDEYTSRKLAEVVYYAKEHSIFYADRLAGCLLNVEGAFDMTEIPFMDASDIVNCGAEMLCVSASAVSRIVSLDTSGSSEGARKSICFTEADQELMIDYVANGLRVMFVDNCGGALDCGSGPAMTGGAERILILMPAERPGSIGDLVAKGVQRFGVAAIPFGVAPSDGSRDEEIFELMREQSVTSILATPQAALRLAQISNAGHYAKGSADASGIMIRDSRLRGNDNVAVDDEESGSADASGIMTRDSRRSLSCAKSQGGNDKRFPRSLLLSGDYVSPAVRDEIERLWDCKVYEHYGMTEMGLGGAMSCEIREGYHIREADLYIEIINPHTGEPVPDGEFGEIVFTTLTRQAMPLIRYRTGDISRIIPSPCPCGSVPRRLERVGSRGQTKDY